MFTRFDAVLLAAFLASGMMALEDHNRVTLSSPDPLAVVSIAPAHVAMQRERTVGELRDCYHRAAMTQLSTAMLMQFEAGALPDEEKAPDGKAAALSLKDCQLQARQR